MKRRICSVVTLALSFLMMFGSPSMAGEIPGGIPVPTSELTDVEVVEIPPAEMNQTDSLSGQKKAKVQVKKKEEIEPVWEIPCNPPCGPGFECNTLGICTRTRYLRPPDVPSETLDR